LALSENGGLREQPVGSESFPEIFPMTSADHFRRIDVSKLPAAELAPQPAPQLLWVEIDQLVIDDRYQRPLNAGNIIAIKRIAADFRWSRFSPVLVAPIEGGRYALIDGQHRAHAAAACGIKSVPAMVMLIAPQEQASAFIAINTSQIRVGAHSVYRAALAAEEPWAIRCRDAVAAAGCRLMGSQQRIDARKPGQVFAIGLIRRMVEAGQDKAVTAGLVAIREYEPASVANFADALLAPWLGAAAETRAEVPELLDALQIRRPWLVINAADQSADQDGQPKARVRRDYFVALIHKAQREAAA
jgi:hypothetical protein